MLAPEAEVDLLGIACVELSPVVLSQADLPLTLIYIVEVAVVLTVDSADSSTESTIGELVARVVEHTVECLSVLGGTVQVIDVVGAQIRSVGVLSDTEVVQTAILGALVSGLVEGYPVFVESNTGFGVVVDTVGTEEHVGIHQSVGILE